MRNSTRSIVVFVAGGWLAAHVTDRCCCGI